MNRTAASSLRTLMAVLRAILGLMSFSTRWALKKIDKAAAISPTREKARRTSCNVKQPLRVLEQRPIKPEATVKALTMTKSHPVWLGLCSSRNSITREATPPTVTMRFSINNKVVENTDINPVNVRPVMIAATFQVVHLLYTGQHNTNLWVCEIYLQEDPKPLLFPGESFLLETVIKEGKIVSLCRLVDTWNPAAIV